MNGFVFWLMQYFALFIVVIGGALIVTFINSKRYKNNSVVIAASKELAELALSCDQTKISPESTQVMLILQANDFNRRQMLVAVDLSGKQLGQYEISEEAVSKYTTYFTETVYKYY